MTSASTYGDNIIRRYGYPPNHLGRCDWFCLRICTCGLMHDLKPLYEDLEDEKQLVELTEHEERMRGIEKNMA